MKKIVFMVCQSALFGWNSPLSFYSEANIENAINSIKNNDCDRAYISLDCIDYHEREHVLCYLERNFLAALDNKILSNIYVSCSSRNYVELFVEYLMNSLPLEVDEVAVKVLAKIYEKRDLEIRIDQAVRTHPGTEYPYRKMPTVYTA